MATASNVHDPQVVALGTEGSLVVLCRFSLAS
jgi:hypothetical protein